MLKKLLHSQRDIFYFYVMGKYLSDCKSVLDVGCGAESPIQFFKINAYKAGIDIFDESIKISKKNKTHNKYIVGDIRKLKEYYKDKSFDAVIALDVIEHLSRNKSIKLISDMEKIAKKKVILLTPNGFYHQDAYDHNPYQIHKSGWGKEDLKKLGYSIRGLRGLKYLRGEQASIQYRPWILWGSIAFISELILFFFPSASYHLLGYKTLNEK